jgi:hypothetical protein
MGGGVSLSDIVKAGHYFWKKNYSSGPSNHFKRTTGGNSSINSLNLMG